LIANLSAQQILQQGTGNREQATGNNFTDYLLGIANSKYELVSRRVTQS